MRKIESVQYVIDLLVMTLIKPTKYTAYWNILVSPNFCNLQKLGDTNISQYRVIHSKLKVLAEFVIEQVNIHSAGTKFCSVIRVDFVKLSYVVEHLCQLLTM